MDKPKLIVFFFGIAVAVPVVSLLRHGGGDSPRRRATPQVHPPFAEDHHYLPSYALALRDDFRRRGDAFFDRMNLVEDDFRPLELEEALEKSATVVTGTIESISDGRVMDFVKGPSHPTYTAVLKVKVSTTLKENPRRGSAAYVYVETVRAPFVKPEELDQIKPTQPVTLFLREAHWRPDVEKYTATGIPSNEPLYALTTSQGLLISTEDGLYTQPLSQAAILPPDVRTFEDVQEAITIPVRGAP